MSHAALRRVYFGTAEGILSHIFAGHGLYHFRAGEEHIGDAFGHDGEVGQSRRVNGTAGTGAEDSRDLWDHAGGKDVALENLSVACQGVDAFLNTCATRVVEADHRGSHLHGHIHDLAYFLCHGLAQRAAEHGEILCEDIDETSVDCSVTGHDAIAEIAFLFLSEVVAAVAHEHVNFLKRSLVEKLGNAFACGVFSAFVLFLDGFLATA